MVNVMESRCQYLLLPRPWLKSAALLREQCSGFKQDALYLRGDAMIAGRVIRLPYWHKVVWTESVES